MSWFEHVPNVSLTNQVACSEHGLWKVWFPGAQLLVLTYGEESMLQLQREGRERNLFRYGQDSHSGEVGGLVPSIPLTARGVEGQAASWRHANRSVINTEASAKHSYKNLRTIWRNFTTLSFRSSTFQREIESFFYLTALVICCYDKDVTAQTKWQTDTSDILQRSGSSWVAFQVLI